MLKRPLDRIVLTLEDKKELEERPNPPRQSTEPTRNNAPLPRGSCVEPLHDCHFRQFTIGAAANAAAGSAATNIAEEVEVKLRLLTREDHSKAKELFKDSYVTTHDQENFFFDGGNGELSLNHHIMRIRFYNKTKKAILTVKGRQSLANGIGRALEEEEGIDVAYARQCLDDPNLILQLDSDLIQRKQEYPLNKRISRLYRELPRLFEIKSLRGLGGFENIRDEYQWNGYTLELDETIYDFGTNFEIECETVEPEALRDRLETLFGEHGIQYQYRTTTKFACFLNRSLEED